jgi:hypothetical protein
MLLGIWAGRRWWNVAGAAPLLTVSTRWSGDIRPVDDAAEFAVLGVSVPPGDVAADHAALFLVGVVVGAVEGEVARGGELGFYSVEPGAVGGGVGDFDVVRASPCPDPLIALGGEVWEKLSQTIAMRTSRG